MSAPSTIAPNTRSGASSTGPVRASCGGGGGGSNAASSTSAPSTSSPASSGPVPVAATPATIIQTTVPFTAFHLENVTEANIRAWKNNRELAVKKGVTLDRMACISGPSLEIITMQFVAFGIINSGDHFLTTMDDITLFQHLNKVFGDQSGSMGMTELDHLMSGIPRIHLDFNPNDSSYTEYFRELSELCTKSGAIGKITQPEMLLVVKKLQESLTHKDSSSKHAKSVGKMGKLIKEQ